MEALLLLFVEMPLAMPLEMEGSLAVMKLPQIFWKAVVKATLKRWPG